MQFSDCIRAAAHSIKVARGMKDGLGTNPCIIGRLQSLFRWWRTTTWTNTWSMRRSRHWSRKLPDIFLVPRV